MSAPSSSSHAIAYRWRSLPRVRRHRASKSQGNSKRVLPWQVTMDQIIFASFSHARYCSEVGMLKVPAPCYYAELIDDRMCCLPFEVTAKDSILLLVLRITYQVGFYFWFLCYYNIHLSITSHLFDMRKSAIPKFFRHEMTPIFPLDDNFWSP